MNFAEFETKKWVYFFRKKKQESLRISGRRRGLGGATPLLRAKIKLFEKLVKICPKVL